MMKMLSVSLIVLSVGLSGLHAQGTNPLSTALKGSWGNIRDLLTKMADRMPEEHYRFKATPDVQDFGQRIAHIIQSDMRTCALVKGEQKPVTFSAAPTKAEAVAAMKEMASECDSVFNAMTDADAMKMIAGGRGGARPAFAVLEGMLEHSQEMYGYMAVYLRLKGIVPPSSDRNER